VNNLAIGNGTSKQVQGNCGHTAVGDVEKYEGRSPELDVFRAPGANALTAMHRTDNTFSEMPEISMSICSTLDRPEAGRNILRNGLWIGLAGELDQNASRFENIGSPKE